MRIVIINKSDSTGGAAVVSRRLMEALRLQDVDARMIVAEKLTDSPYITLAASPSEIKWKFLLERLRIFIANGFNRSTLFKIDTGEEGLTLWRHPWVKEADAILLNWINQGMLSLNGIRKILKLNKPVVWTMHDMWCMTGICHHAGECRRYLADCGDCPLLGSHASSHDLSRKIHDKKEALYNLPRKITFVAVSHWLKEKAGESNLLKHERVEVIPNAFQTLTPSSSIQESNLSAPDKIRILFGAARIDDPIKGLDTLKESLSIISRQNPEEAARLEIAFFGNVKDAAALDGFPIPVVRLGTLKGEEAVAHAYHKARIVVSSSSYETLPGTLVEAQAYGCFPVAFNQGGQKDIIRHLSTGYLAEYSPNLHTRASNLADGILKALEIVSDPQLFSHTKKLMAEEAEKKFSYSRIARSYIKLINSLSANKPSP